eukprot:TRINITY_DN40580_c0_g1_i1.p1 TRINITY_DN40580_c0_g1~~TRINITY_DN40580_c0_g1_i1.p1  ORF type:complete len:601 (-),score=140.23 TRINITY_DN40580_c0_g1_i1:26-1801(-)
MALDSCPTQLELQQHGASDASPPSKPSCLGGLGAAFGMTVSSLVSSNAVEESESILKTSIHECSAIQSSEAAAPAPSDSSCDDAKRTESLVPVSGASTQADLAWRRELHEGQQVEVFVARTETGSGGWRSATIGTCWPGRNNALVTVRYEGAPGDGSIHRLLARTSPHLRLPGAPEFETAVVEEIGTAWKIGDVGEYFSSRWGAKWHPCRVLLVQDRRYCKLGVAPEESLRLRLEVLVSEHGDGKTFTRGTFKQWIFGADARLRRKQSYDLSPSRTTQDDIESSESAEMLSTSASDAVFGVLRSSWDFPLSRAEKEQRLLHLFQKQLKTMRDLQDASPGERGGRFGEANDFPLSGAESKWRLFAQLQAIADVDADLPKETDDNEGERDGGWLQRHAWEEEGGALSPSALALRQQGESDARVRSELFARQRRAEDKVYLLRDQESETAKCLFKEGNLCWEAGDREMAAKLHAEAKRHQNLAQGYKQRAAELALKHCEEMFEHVQQNEHQGRIRDGSWIDLHGLSPDFAESRTAEAVAKAKHLGIAHLQVITGAGKHSGAAGPVVKQQVLSFLKEQNLPFREETAGSFIVLVK